MGQIVFRSDDDDRRYGGSWWVRSKTDPRWNRDGYGSGTVSGGGPASMRQWMEDCEKKYGEAPEDCEFGFVKY